MKKKQIITKEQLEKLRIEKVLRELKKKRLK
jgi:hypothetical protein